MPVHWIRLRHPWRCEPLAEAAVWRRRFNRPTGLGSGQRVFLVIDDLPIPGTVTLNGQPLGSLSGRAEAQPFEVTGKLCQANEVALRLEGPPPLDWPVRTTVPGEVRLEIHQPEGWVLHPPDE